MSERLKNPYGCMICHKTFSVSLHLVKHVELKHLSSNQPPIKPLIKVEPKVRWLHALEGYWLLVFIPDPGPDTGLHT